MAKKKAKATEEKSAEKQTEFNVEEHRARIEKARAWECPDCGNKLEACPANEVHAAHQPQEKGRKCTNAECTYKCYFADDNSVRPNKVEPLGGRKFTKDMRKVHPKPKGPTKAKEKK